MPPIVVRQRNAAYSIFRAFQSNREHCEDRRDERIRKPSKDELSYTSFVEVKNATLGNAGTVARLEICSVGVWDFEAEVAALRIALATQRFWAIEK